MGKVMMHWISEKRGNQWMGSRKEGPNSDDPMVFDYLNSRFLNIHLYES